MAIDDSYYSDKRLLIFASKMLSVAKEDQESKRLGTWLLDNVTYRAIMTRAAELENGQVDQQPKGGPLGAWSL